MTEPLPDWLLAATGGRPGRVLRPRRGPVRPGDLCRIEHAGEARVVLVIDLDARRDHASVILTHAEPDQRTSDDVLLTTPEAGVPWPVVLELDVVQVVPASAIAGTRLGAVTVDIRPLRDAVWTGEATTDLTERAAIALRGPGDPRWAWKAAEAGWLAGAADVLEARAQAETRVAVVSLLRELRASIGMTVPATDPEPDRLAPELLSLLLRGTAGRRPLPPGPVRTLTLPRVAGLLGQDAWRAIEPVLLVA